MAHAQHRVFTHDDRVEDPGLLNYLAERLTMLPGRVAVFMDPVPGTFAPGGLILAPEGKHHGKYRPDTGTVIHGYADPEPGLSVSRGDRVAVNPYDGLWLRHEDYDWIPEGREMRLYGVADWWGNSVLFRFAD
jgi:hypothetical protein